MTATLAVIGGPGHRAAGQDILLGPSDRVAISVFSRPDLSGEFRVLPAGTLSMPYIGSVPAGGHTLDELKDAVVARLKSDAFLLDPRVNVDLIETRPVFVGGEVRRPGTFAFLPGMTVEHVISAAGGLRQLDIDALNAHMQASTAREKLRHAMSDYGVMLMRRARLAAEKANSLTIAVPNTIGTWLTPDRLRETLAAENALLIQRNAAHASQIEALTREIAIYDSEIKALGNQDASKLREADLVRKEADYDTQLVAQGIGTRTARLIELPRNVVRIQAERSRIAGDVDKAKQEIARVNQAVILLRSQRLTELIVSSKEADDALSGLDVTIEESRRALRDADDALPPAGAAPAAAADPKITIVRHQGDVNARLQASDDTPLQPGDLVVVGKP